MASSQSNDIPSPAPAPASGRKIKIFVKGLNWVGDAVMSTPALHHLRRSHPDAHITLMVRPWVAAVFEHSPDIDELWVHDDAASPLAFVKAVQRVRQGCFRFGVALPNSFRSALLMQLGGIRYRIGYRRHHRGWLLNQGVDVDPKVLKQHQVFYYLKLIEGLCGKAQHPIMSLTPGEVEKKEVERLLRQHGLEDARALVGLAPGSINSNAKRWGADRFAALADLLVKQYGAQVILLGSPKEKDVLEQVQSLAQSKLYEFSGQMNLAQSMALIDRMKALVTNDAGAMHIAAALRVPTVAVFGPTEWYTTYPYSPVARIVRKKDVECSPCMLRECPIDHKCMTGVSVEDVMKTLEDLLKHAKTLETQPGPMSALEMMTHV